MNECPQEDDSVEISQYRASIQAQLDLGRAEYREAARNAPPAAPDAPMHVTSDLSGMPNPFPKALKVKTEEDKWSGQPCAKCFKALGKRGGQRPIQCDICRDVWHMQCAGKAIPQI